MLNIMNKNRHAYEREVTKEHHSPLGRFQLFRAALPTGLADMSEIGFDNEKQMQKLVENNIETLFPGLKFLKTEFRDMTEGERRLDTIAFDTNESTFVVMEYKNKPNNTVLAQAKAYLRDMEQSKANLVLEHSRMMDCRPRDKQSFHWNDMYAIIMASEFAPYQIPGASNDQEVEMYEIKMYDGFVMTVNRVGGAHIHEGMPKPDKPVGDGPKLGDLQSRNGSDRTKPKPPRSISSEDEYLKGNYGTTPPTEQTKKLYFKLKNQILDSFPNIEYIQKKKYAGFYLKKNGPAICTLDVSKNKIRTFYTTKQKNLISAGPFVMDYAGRHHWGLGDYCSDVKNESDIAKAISNIERVYNSKAG